MRFRMSLPFLPSYTMTLARPGAIEIAMSMSRATSRFFAPGLGINEDPVTGSANGPLGVYLFERGEVEAKGPEVTLVGEQGDAIGRKGRVFIRLGVKGTVVTSLQIGGRAVTVYSGEMRIR